MIFHDIYHFCTKQKKLNQHYELHSTVHLDLFWRKIELIAAANGIDFIQQIIPIGTTGY